MNEQHKYVRFDWAAKRILRDKANFDVLEGLITVLLNEPIHIVEILESEGNQDQIDDKFNRVDIKAKNSKGEIIIVEIQLTREVYYLERILYGVSKAITEHISLGNKYDQIHKVYSISILYFDLGKGADYLYHGTTSFVGVHTHDTLQFNARQKRGLSLPNDAELQQIERQNIFPEYYLIRVNEFNKVARTPLEEWLDYLKRGYISDTTSAPGLREARKKLQYLQMTKAERNAYDHHLDAIMIQNDVIDSAREEGLMEGEKVGRAKGLAEGLEKGKAEGLAEGFEKGKSETIIAVARKLKASGLSLSSIKIATGLSEEELATL